MISILLIAFTLIALTAGYSINRFGFSLAGFLHGDGDAILQAATALVAIWALVVSFGITAIGATVELSKLPSEWKFSLFRKTIVRKLIPFFILSILTGIIPFVSILHSRTEHEVSTSFVTPWLIVSFILLLLLVASACLAATASYRELALVPAIKSTLAGISDQQLMELQEASSEKLKDEFNAGNRLALMPFSGFAGGLNGIDSWVHDEISLVFRTVLLNNDPQQIDTGLKVISEWMGKHQINLIDGYLQYRLLPRCLQEIGAELDRYKQYVFRTRIYYLCKLALMLHKAGAVSSGSNLSKPIWELIEDYAKMTKMSQALVYSKYGIEMILNFDFSRGGSLSLMLINLQRSFDYLVKEHSEQSISLLEWILELYRRSFESCHFKFWPSSSTSFDHSLNSIRRMYELLEQEYSNEQALWAGAHDLRYWIIITLRRIQDLFVSMKSSNELEDGHRSIAYQTYDKFDKTIEELLEIRKPVGDEAAYKNKYPANPYS